MIASAIAACSALASLALATPAVRAASLSPSPATSCAASNPFSASGNPTVSGWYTNNYSYQGSVCVGTIDSTFTTDTTSTYTYRVRVWQSGSNALLYDNSISVSGGAPSVKGAIAVRTVFGAPVYVCAGWELVTTWYVTCATVP